MKNFIGKMLNLGGIVGLILINSFICIFYILTFAMGETILGDFSDLIINPSQSYYLLPMIFFGIYFILFVGFVIVDLKSLVNNQGGKISFLLSILFCMCSLGMILIIVKQRYIQGIENPGINLSFVYWCGGIDLFFTFLVMIGNALKIRKV
jgi:glucan phosphoethanolaminetransferase (alkaline phosphatase superfamily)